MRAFSEGEAAEAFALAARRAVEEGAGDPAFEARRRDAERDRALAVAAASTSDPEMALLLGDALRKVREIVERARGRRDKAEALVACAVEEAAAAFDRTASLAEGFGDLYSRALAEEGYAALGFFE